MEKTAEADSAINEGEGNKTAAREFNEAQRQFVKSGRVKEKARDAERALEGPERQELEKAEAIGKSHIADEDPLLSSDEKIRTRAYEIWVEEGRPEGREQEHWHRATKEIVDRG